jgi:hypothetical protein
MVEQAALALLAVVEVAAVQAIAQTASSVVLAAQAVSVLWSW